MGIFRDFFTTAGSPSLDVIRPGLWRPSGDGDRDGPEDKSAVLEQYKLYVEMADRISARRALANTFFLTLNTAVATAAGVFWNKPPDASAFLLAVPWLALVGQCLAWFWILRSYRQLNTAKYAVIGAMEERLPASPYWRAEWAALGEGTDPRRYWPLSHVESLIPGFFALIYTAAFVAVLVN